MISTTLRGETITVPVVVHDASAQAFAILPADYYEVKEDNKLVEVVQVTQSVNEPVWMVIAIEYSRNLPSAPYGWYVYPYEDVLAEAAYMGYALVMRAREDDRLGLVTFGTTLRIVQDFTLDRQAIVIELERLLNDRVGPTASESATLQTVATLFNKLRAQASARKIALVVIGSGFDTFGNVAHGELMQMARSYNIQLFFVQTGFTAIQRIDGEMRRSGKTFDPRLPPSPMNDAWDTPEQAFQRAYYWLSVIAKTSVGWAVQLRFITQCAGDAEEIFSRVKYRQLLTYEAPPVKADGKLHKLSIRIKKPVVGPNGAVLKNIKAQTVDGRRLVLRGKT